MEQKNDQELEAAKGKGLADWLDTVGWALFFIWVGIAFLADLGWGLGLIGVGVIILATSVAGRYLAGPTGSRSTICGPCSTWWMK